MLFQIDYDLYNWSWLLDPNRPFVPPVIPRPSASVRDDVESALITAPIIGRGGVGSSGVLPKRVEPPTQSTSPEIVARKRKCPARAILKRRRDVPESPQPKTLEVWFCF